jgi:predicted RNA binding protein YcfA (HicA-like mRNA interferase family)
MASKVRFGEVRRMIESHGWELDRIRGSHHIFTKPYRRNIVIPVHNGLVKASYVREAEKIIEEAGD